MRSTDKIAKHFGDKAKVYVERAKIQERIANEVISSIPSYNFVEAVELGCGPGVNFKALLSKALRVTGVDIAVEMCIEAQKLELNNTKVINANIEEFNLGGYDLIFSSLAIHWCDFNKFWECLCRSIDKRAYLALAIPVDGSMYELKDFLNEATKHNRVHIFPKEEEIIEKIKRESPNLDISNVKINVNAYKDEFYTIDTYLGSIRGIGANCVKESNPITKKQYFNFQALLQDALLRNKKLIHTYKVLEVTGFISKIDCS